MADKYCCSMRRHFLFGIIGNRKDEPTPIEAADFIMDWGPPIVIAAKFCPFCGKEITGERRITNVPVQKPRDL